jgi:hypothetical protein
MSDRFEPGDERESDGVMLADPQLRQAEPTNNPPTKRAAPSPRPSRKRDEDDDDESFFARNRLAIIAGVLVLAGGAWVFFHKPSAPSQPAKKAPEQVVRIQLPPPPPPLPPPKVQPPPPKDDKRVEQTPMAKPEPKPEAAKPKPDVKPPEGLGTNNKGPGPGLAGLGNSGDGMLGGTGSKGGGGGGSMAKWYAGQVGSKIEAALRNHRKTRSASLRVDAKVWVDGHGRVTRATLDNSSGDKSLDDAITNEILPGIQLSEPPPAKMRMPIPLRFNARRPN